MCVVIVSADEADDYCVMGVAMAVSLVHEGPAPAFFSKELYSAIIGDPAKVAVKVPALPDGPMKADFTRVCWHQPLLQYNADIT